jgi:hypothetical protein
MIKIIFVSIFCDHGFCNKNIFLKESKWKIRHHWRGDFGDERGKCELIQRGFTRVIFESDSKVVVDAILSRNVGVSEFSSIISSI